MKLAIRLTTDTSLAINKKNSNGTKCWCPTCGEIKKPGTVASWTLTETGEHICFYSMCVRCSDIFSQLPEQLKTETVDMVEEALASRYEERLNLPSGYFEK